jgi:small-conductance mechanosensitive channel
MTVVWLSVMQVLLVSAWAQMLPVATDKKGNTPSQSDQTVDATLSNSLQQVQKELAALGAEGVSLSSQAQVKREVLLQIQSLIHERQVLQSETLLNQDKHTLASREWSDLAAGEGPWSVLKVDPVRNARRALELVLENQGRVLADSEAEQEYLDKKLLEKQQALRAGHDQPGGLSSAKEEILGLEMRLAEQRAKLGQLRLKTVRAEYEAVGRALQEAKDALSHIGKRLYFDEKMYQSIKADLENLTQEIDQRISFKRKEMEDAQAPHTAEKLFLLKRELESLGMIRDRIPEDKLAWERRYKLFNESVPDELKSEWLVDAKKQAERLGGLLRIKRARFDGASSVSPSPLTILASEKEQMLSALTSISEESQLSVKNAQNLHLNLARDLELIEGGFRLEASWAKVLGGLQAAWRFELFSIDDRAVTVKKVLIALLLVLIGVRLARWVSHRLVRRVLSKVRVEESASLAISTLIFYGLAIIVFVAALGWAGIPLTLFTLFGGALAIGFGFGSQNIIKNFISGLILLIERPIRPGDMVDVSDTHGRVIRVGLRCTQIRTFTNIDILVPNSLFLESNVINWTLTNDETKVKLSLGVAYGSDVNKVRELMLKAAKENTKIMNHPPPEVFFADFGNDALMFQLVFWIRMKQPSDQLRVESELRFKLDALFKEHQLVIAFPQRDVHLDTTRPLDIRLMSGDQPALP